MADILPPQDEFPAEIKKEIRKIAKSYIEADNLLVWVINQAGQLVEKPMDKLPDKTKIKINKVIQPALHKVFDMAVNLHDYEEELNQNETVKKIKATLNNKVFKSSNQVAATLSGLVGGVGGTYTTLLELPIAFGLIFKEILKVSADYERDPRSETTRMECLAIFLSGTSLEEDDYSDSGFIAARIALTGSKAVNLINRFAPGLIRIFGPKIVSPPVIGAAIGATINYVYIDYFRRIAHVQFRISRLAQFCDPVQVHEEFKHQVNQIKEGRKLLK